MRADETGAKMSNGSLPAFLPFPGPTRFVRAIVTTRALDFRRNEREARAALASALGLSPSAFVRAEQVHGSRVAIVSEPTGESVPGADALATRASGLALLALGADCPGVAILSDEDAAIAVAHSGWRGAVADVGPKAALDLVSWGSRASALRAWIGPGIGACCFEVGDEVVSAFEEVHGPLGSLVSRPKGGKAHVDLKGAIARRLVERAGLSPANVSVSPDCTRCSCERFFSRRGEGPDCGHHALIAWVVR
ncbi:laccase domain-containing protein [bacterium]|nr:laccase domain-containing protein [bacterium]